MECKAFLFDLDGTLVNSLKIIEEAWRSWAEKNNLNTDYDHANLHGMQAIPAIKLFMPNATEPELKKAFIDIVELEFEKSRHVRALPGALALLKKIIGFKIPWAIVTSGTRQIAYARHSAAGLPYPDVFITAEFIKNSKPEPDGYLLAAKALNVKPEECVVIEDAAVGVLSGINANCQVIGVNVPENQLDLSGASKFVNSLDMIILNKNDNENTVTLTFKEPKNKRTKNSKTITRIKKIEGK